MGRGFHISTTSRIWHEKRGEQGISGLSGSHTNWAYGTLHTSIGLPAHSGTSHSSGGTWTNETSELMCCLTVGSNSSLKGTSLSIRYGYLYLRLKRSSKEPIT